LNGLERGYEVRLRSIRFLALALLFTGGCSAARVAKPGAPDAGAAPEAGVERASSRPPKPVAASSGKLPTRSGRRSVADVMATLGTDAERRLREKFAANDVPYPPTDVFLLAFKQEQRIELWAKRGASYAFVDDYPLTDTSGTLGPKLRQGDYQIPEGIYRVSWLHPNSQYHLSLKLDYPNEFDRARAAEDRRTGLGGDIFIHGDEHSIGCLAVGDRAIEELFALAARVGREQVTVVISPWDFRRRPAPAAAADPSWVPLLYAQLGKQLSRFHDAP
jgi:hypothetical protein